MFMSEKPPLPTLQNIPQALVDQWVQIPNQRKLSLRVTKGDIDALFFAVNNLINSQNQLQQSLIRYSNGEIDAANEHMDLSQRASIESLNSLRAFLTSLISSELHAKAGDA
jgi:hypothetical protein